MTSRTAEPNKRPSIKWISGRTAKPAPLTPRSDALLLSPPRFSGNRTIASASADASGLRSIPSLIPGASKMVWVASRVILLKVSKPAPALTTMARSARPVLVIICDRPPTMARMLTRTPTTPAMPMTMTDEAPRRCGTLLRFIIVTEPICLSTRIEESPSAPGQGVYDDQPLRTPCRRQAAHQRKRHRNRQAQGHDFERQRGAPDP